MRAMEERMKEIELSLHNVKLLLKEKVAQLKDQVGSCHAFQKVFNHWSGLGSGSLVSPRSYEVMFF